MAYVAKTISGGIEYRATGNTYPEAINNCIQLIKAHNEQADNGKYHVVGGGGQGTKQGSEQTTT